MKHWSVYGVIDDPRPVGQGGSHWKTNKTIEIVCESAARAIQLVEQKYPGIVVHSVQHRGGVEIIQDSYE